MTRSSLSSPPIRCESRASTTETGTRYARGLVPLQAVPYARHLPTKRIQYGIPRHGSSAQFCTSGSLTTMSRRGTTWHDTSSLMLPNGHRTEIQSSRFITTVRSLLTKRTDEHSNGVQSEIAVRLVDRQRNICKMLWLNVFVLGCGSQEPKHLSVWSSNSECEIASSVNDALESIACRSYSVCL